MQGGLSARAKGLSARTALTRGPEIQNAPRSVIIVGLFNRVATTPDMSSRFFQASDSSSDSSSEEEELYSGEEPEGEKKKKKPEAQDSDDSEESSEEDEDEEDEDEDEDDSDESSEDETAGGVNRFLKSDDEDESSEEEEDKVTVVKSAKDKKFEELEGTIRLMENAEKISDWVVISSGKYMDPKTTVGHANMDL